MKDFYELVRDKRSELGLSVRDIERATRESPGSDVSRTMVSFMERGTRKPSYETALAITEALDIDLKTGLLHIFQTRLCYELANEKKQIKRILEDAGQMGRIDFEEIISTGFLEEC